MTAAAIEPEVLTPEQELYRAEKARRADRVRPEMVAAAAELQRIEDLARENGKGGRPKQNPFNVGKGTRPRRAEPDPDAPGRPEWLTPPTPPRDEPTLARHPSPSTPMPSGIPANGFKKTCERSGQPYTATGARQKWCGTCDECVEAAGETKTSKKKAKPDKPEKKRKPINTGFRGEPPRSKRGGAALAGAIEHIESQIAALDARRERLVEIIASLREADAA